MMNICFGQAGRSGIPRLGKLLQFVRSRHGTGPQGDVADRKFAGITVRLADRGCQCHGGMRLQRVLDDKRINVVATTDDQVL